MRATLKAPVIERVPRAHPLWVKGGGDAQHARKKSKYGLGIFAKHAVSTEMLLHCKASEVLCPVDRHTVTVIRSDNQASE